MSAAASFTSNKSFGDWGSVLGDTVLATAVLDRLLHHASVVNIRGENYRLKERRKAGLLSTLAGREKQLNKEVQHKQAHQAKGTSNENQDEPG